LAAALCLRIRDANRKALPADVIATPKLQVLLYPALQAVDLKTPSYQQATPVLHSDDMAAFYVNYLTGGVEGYEKVMENQHVSPEMKRDYAEKYVKHGLIPKELHSNYEPPVSQDFDARLSTKLERMVRAVFRGGPEGLVRYH
jgi:acetyl esterase/lipase